MLTPERTKQIAFQAIQLARRLAKEHDFSDQKDADDWVFSEMDLEVNEALEIFADYPKTRPYLGSCYPDNTSPKDYDSQHFQTP